MTDPVSIPADVVKRLREETGAGMMECKRALVEGAGDLEKARQILREKGLAGIQKRAGRRASEGLIDAYVHGEDRRYGAIVEVNCETDFVARTEDFRRLAREIAMQIVSLDPWWISREDVPADVVEGERKIYEEQARATGKPDNVIQRIVDGKIEAFFGERVLMEQPYIRDGSKKVGDLVQEMASKVGENVVIRRFTRYRLGEEV
jgi:elongation factor Ts